MTAIFAASIGAEMKTKQAIALRPLRSLRQPLFGGLEVRKRIVAYSLSGTASATFELIRLIDFNSR
jgi:hypothetical protein